MKINRIALTTLALAAALTSGCASVPKVGQLNLTLDGPTVAEAAVAEMTVAHTAVAAR